MDPQASRPFVAASTTDAVRGSLPLYALTIAGLLGLYVAVCSMAKHPRAKVAIVMGLTFALTARSMSSARQLPAARHGASSPGSARPAAPPRPSRRWCGRCT